MKKLLITMFTCVSVLLGGMVNADAASFRVSHDVPLSWSASYTIVTSGDHIKDVKNVKATARMGKITKTYVSYDAANRVTLHISRKLGIVSYKTGLVAKISKGKLIVTAI